MTAAGNGQRPHLDGEDRRPGDRSGGLPLPGHERWQPLRAGLVDLFLYDDEEFRFRDGHLLLRGNNGTGKSKVLALMLPFLLDGELAPTGSSPAPTRASGWSGTSCSAVATRSGSATPGWSAAASPRMAAPRTSPSAAASRPSPAAGSPPAGPWCERARDSDCCGDLPGTANCLL